MFQMVKGSVLKPSSYDLVQKFMESDPTLYRLLGLNIETVSMPRHAVALRYFKI
jgi:hypothetical protein